MIGHSHGRMGGGKGAVHARLARGMLQGAGRALELRLEVHVASLQPLDLGRVRADLHP